jgi:multiple sugar transport system permease protein
MSATGREDPEAAMKAAERQSQRIYRPDPVPGAAPHARRRPTIRFEGVQAHDRPMPPWESRRRRASARRSWDRLKTNRHGSGAWFMLPGAGVPASCSSLTRSGLGIWMSFTDARIGRPGEFIGLENYEWLLDDDAFIGATLFTIGYTVVASVFKFAIGLYLALLLNKHIPFRAIVRAVILIPFIVPTVLSAIAFWWIFDPNFSIVSWSLRKLGLISGNVNFLGDPLNAQMSVIFANIWRGIPFIAITLLAGLQTVPASLYEAATLDGASRWQMFRSSPTRCSPRSSPS